MSLNNKNNDLITVGITSYNSVDTIGKAIMSAIEQSWKPLEVIIVDDASSDNSVKIIEEMIKKHDNVKLYVNEKNMGVAASRNKILEVAKGSFVAFFDDDDFSSSTRITEQFNRICEYEKKFARNMPVVCHTARLQIYPDGSKQYVQTMGENDKQLAPNGIAVADRILKGKSLKGSYGACATCSQMARLSVYKKIEGFDVSLRRGEDTDFNIRLAIAGGHFVGISNALVTQKMTKTEDKNIDDELKNTLIIFEKHKVLMNETGEFEFCCSWLELKYAFLKRNYLLFSFMLLRLLIRHPVWTFKRVFISIPNLRVNQLFSRFYLKL